MLSFKFIAPLAFYLFSTSCIAAPSYKSYSNLHRRQDTPVLLTSPINATDPPSITVGISNTTVATAAASATSTLIPVLPPSVDGTNISVLALDTQVTLAWAGGSQASTRRRMKRDGAVYSQANFTFQYPVVPLDHSNYVSNVSCSGGQLTGTLSSVAYSFVKQEWAEVPDIVFVTSVDGCGADTANDYFLATSVTFTDSSMTFAANGSSAMLKNVGSHMALQLGTIGSTNVKRAIDKSVMFDDHSLYKRGRADLTFQWGAWLNGDDFLGTDDDAPWENAALLAEFGSDGEEEDDSRDEGEEASSDGHHKRSTNGTSLRRRDDDDDGLSYGLKLYCVECGFGGQADLWAEVDVDIFPPSLNAAKCGLDLTMVAGFALGFDAFVDYTKTWEKELGKIYLGGFSILEVIDVGPFISVSVQATADINASGQLLVGANATWDGISVTLDILNPDNSGVDFPGPTFMGIVDASGEVGVSASLGLPLELGVGFSILDDLFEASAGIVDTPSIVVEGQFEVSADIDSDGDIELDLNGGCYGIAWDVHFQNELDAVLSCSICDDLSFPLIDPEESAPIAQGCIGYVDDGTDDVDDSTTGTGSDTGLGGNGLNSAGDGLSGSNPGGSVSSAVVSSSSSSSSTSASSSSISSSASSSTASSSSGTVVNGAVLFAASTTTASTSSSASSSSTTPSSSASASKSASSSLTSSAASSASSTTRSASSSSASAAVSSTASSSHSSSSTSPAIAVASSAASSSHSSSSSSSTTALVSSSSRSISSSTTTTSKATSSTTSSTSSSSVKISSSSATSQSTSSSSKQSTSSSTSSSASSSKASSSTSASSSSVKASSSASSSQPISSSSTTKSSSISSSTTSTSVSSSKVTTTTTTSTCTRSTAAVAATTTASAVTCSATVTHASVPSATSVDLGSAATLGSVNLCAQKCLNSTSCLSFSYGSAASSCQLYNKAYKSLGVTNGGGNSAATLAFFDQGCFMYNTC